jgi:hypothetical protein
MSTATPGRPRLPAPARQTGERIAHYQDPDGRRREILKLAGARGSTLVVDQIAGTEGDRRLIAHLCADEPRENAAIICGLYLREQRRPCCRLLRAADLGIDPIEEAVGSGVNPSFEPEGEVLADSDRNLYALHGAPTPPGLPQLRWRRVRAGLCAVPELVTLRELVAALEDYQPAVALTKRATGSHEPADGVSVTVLRAELRRLLESPIVLNRGLREAVLAAISQDGLSMSEIAIRCGRRKHDRRGCESGETSWLGRRIGILPEGGQLEPTPWVHSDVLALIARDGLGIAPREVELG